MPQTPETITLSTFSMTGLALYGYKLAKVLFLHYFWQQFYLGAKDNQKACIQSTIVILTLLRLHHMKKKTQACGASHPQTPNYIRRPQVFFRCFQGNRKHTKWYKRYKNMLENIIFIYVNLFLKFCWQSCIYSGPLSFI